jgi:broad specificity phosphatase PhoE
MPSAAVYTSPYPRAIETAQPFCDAIGIEAIVDSRVAEFPMPLNTVEGILERPDLLIWRPDHSGVLQGECLREFCERVHKFCDDIAQRHRNGSVVVFTHCGTIDAVLRWAVGLSPEEPWQHEFDLATGSITEIQVWPQGRVPGGAPRYAFIQRIGDCAHLGDLFCDF